MQQLSFSIEPIGLDSPLLRKVIDLYSKRKARLGLFPEGAFEECASRGWVIAAVDSEGNVLGYLLFRVAKDRAAIVHLVVASGWVGRGIARDLVAHLITETRHLLGISLRCRRDYNLAGMWIRFGFTVRDSKVGRGADGALLDYWWFDHNHDDLFSVAARRESETAIPAAIDANIFYDLTCDSRPHADDTRVLEADWLRDSIHLYITPELFNEIHRGTDEAAKKKARVAAQAYRLLRTNTAEVESITSNLKQMLQREEAPRDESDIRQVAYAISNQVPFFITRDRPLLAEAYQIGNRFGIQVIHPVDLIVRFDTLQRQAYYRPASLEGSRWRVRLVLHPPFSSAK
jgi:GNAT superfamily N-acetyltransferase/predicted nucleic acid-binding protein